MKTTIIIISTLAVIFILSSEMKVTLKPFSIKLESITNGLGWLMVVIGINLVIYTARNRADKEGFKRGAEAVIEEIQKQHNNQP